MKGRKPRADELDLWNKVAKGVVRTSPALERNDAPEYQVAPPKQNKPMSFGPGLRPTGPTTPVPVKDDLSPSISQQLRSAPVQMDRKAFGRLTRGKLTPEAKIDLHGMTADRAHAALNRFVMSSHANGKRLLLVITGKGKHRDDGGPIPVRYGVLRHQVPQWLRLPPLGAIVMQVTEAHRSHGGSGALYVYLRRIR